MTDLKNFAYRVSLMRGAQRQYFQLIATAKKTKLPKDFAAAAIALKSSKDQEQVIDSETQNILFTTA